MQLPAASVSFVPVLGLTINTVAPCRQGWCETWAKSESSIFWQIWHGRIIICNPFGSAQHFFALRMRWAVLYRRRIPSIESQLNQLSRCGDCFWSSEAWVEYDGICWNHQASAHSVTRWHRKMKLNSKAARQSMLKTSQSSEKWRNWNATEKHTSTQTNEGTIFQPKLWGVLLCQHTLALNNYWLLSMTLQHFCNIFVIIWRSPASHVCVKEFLFRAQAVPAIKA